MFMTPYGIVVFIILLLLVNLLTTWTLNQYISFKETHAYVTIVVWIGWLLSFFIVFLIPLDVASVREKKKTRNSSFFF